MFQNVLTTSPWPSAPKAYFCFDAEGTLWDSGQPAFGAREFLDLVRKRGWPFVVLTNTVSRTPNQISRQWAKFGLGVTPGQLITPFDSLNHFLKQEYPQSQVGQFRWVGSAQQARRLSRQATKKSPEWVILGDLESFSWNLNFLNSVVNDLRNGAKLAALSPSLFYRMGAKVKLDTGSFVRLLKPFLHEPVLILGKPNPLMLDPARERCGGAQAKCLVMGDDASTDVQMARSAGALSLLLRQGKYLPGDEDKVNPNWCAGSLAEAAQLLEQWWDSP